MEFDELDEVLDELRKVLTNGESQWRCVATDSRGRDFIEQMDLGSAVSRGAGSVWGNCGNPVDRVDAATPQPLDQPARTAVVSCIRVSSSEGSWKSSLKSLGTSSSATSPLDGRDRCGCAVGSGTVP